MSLQQKLRKLIDEAAGQGNLQPIQEFMVLYPDIDFNATSPNGLSALWWALTPPIGKEINQDLVRLFLGHTNIVQTYQGYTPRQYLTFVDPKKFKQLIKDIEKAEDQFVAQANNENQPRGNLAAIANDSQNVHSSAVVKDTDESVKRLYARYGAQLNTVVMLKEIRKHFFPLARGYSLFPSPLEKALNATESDYTHREYTLGDGKTIQLNLSDLLCLAWSAANETDVTLLCGSTVSEADKKLRLEAISKALEDGLGYCWTGRSSRIVNALNAMHVDIRHEKKILDNEQSWNKYQAIISQEIASLAENNKELFWFVMQENLSLIDGTKHTEAYIEILLKTQKLIETLASEMVNEEVIKQINEQLKESTLPIQFFLPFQKLEIFQVIFKKNKSDKFNNIIKDAKTESINDLFNLLIEAFPYDEVINELDEDEYINKIDRGIKRRIIQNAIYQYTKSKDKFDGIKPLFNMEYTDEYLTSHNPAYTDWYKALSSELKKLFIGNISDFSDQNIFDFSVENNCLRQLKVANLDLSGADLRGLDLSQVDFSRLKLRDADLRLATLSGSTKLNLTNAILSEHLFYVLIENIQNAVARSGQAPDSDINYAKLLLANTRLDFKKKDQAGVMPLHRILGQNRFDDFPFSFSGYYIGMRKPPICELLDEPKIVELTSRYDRLVEVIPINRRIQGLSNPYLTTLIFCMVGYIALCIFLNVYVANSIIPEKVFGATSLSTVAIMLDVLCMIGSALSTCLFAVYFILRMQFNNNFRFDHNIRGLTALLVGLGTIFSVGVNLSHYAPYDKVSTSTLLLFLTSLQLINYLDHGLSILVAREFNASVLNWFLSRTDGSGYQSTYHHPFIFTGKATERVKSIGLSVVSIFKCTQRTDDQQNLLGSSKKPNYGTIV